jgi:hypothetical protein
MNESEIRSIIKNKINKKNAPGLVRLAFHDSGNFCQLSNTGGVSGIEENGNDP